MKQPRSLPLDFAQAYRNHLQELGFKEKSPAEWDNKAPSFNRRNQSSPYLSQFLGSMDLRPSDTVLDIGCGPGGLALQMARTVQHVYALDHSPKMLECLRDNAQAASIGNITPIALSKEADWQGCVPVCDIVVSSRSGLDRDLAAFFGKINRYARRDVYFSTLVGGNFRRPEIDSLLQRTPRTFPDYIYALNILYQMGYDADLRFIETPGRLSDCADEGDFLARMHDEYGELDAQSLAKLRIFYQQHAHEFNGSRFAMKWALLHWRVSP